MATHSSILAWRISGQRNTGGCRPWGCKELDVTESLREFIHPGDSDGKVPACNAGDLGLMSGSGRSPGEENGNPLQYSCLENSMNGGAWQATAHWVAKESDTTWQLNNNNLYESHRLLIRHERIRKLRAEKR